MCLYGYVRGDTGASGSPQRALHLLSAGMVLGTELAWSARQTLIY